MSSLHLWCHVISLGVAETAVGKVLCGNVNIAPCLFNLGMRSLCSYTIGNTNKLSKHI